MDALESFFHVGWVEANQWILADLGATNSFGFDFVNRAFATLFFLSKREVREDGNESEQCNESDLSSVFHVLVPLKVSR
jgi:hypothetical protein